MECGLLERCFFAVGELHVSFRPSRNTCKHCGFCTVLASSLLTLLTQNLSCAQAVSDTLVCIPFVQSSWLELNFDIAVGLLSATGALLQQVLTRARLRRRLFYWTKQMRVEMSALAREANPFDLSNLRRWLAEAAAQNHEEDDDSNDDDGDGSSVDDGEDGTVFDADDFGFDGDSANVQAVPRPVSEQLGQQIARVGNRVTRSKSVLEGKNSQPRQIGAPSMRGTSKSVGGRVFNVDTVSTNADFWVRMLG